MNGNEMVKQIAGDTLQSDTERNYRRRSDGAMVRVTKKLKGKDRRLAQKIAKRQGGRQ